MRQSLLVAGAAGILATAVLSSLGLKAASAETKLAEQWGTSDNPSQFGGSTQATTKTGSQGAKSKPTPKPKPKPAEGSTQPQTEPIR